MKKVLLYLGKFPGYGFDIDGGSIMAKQLIDTLKSKCLLDVVFIRKKEETYEDMEVNSIRYVEYKDAFNNKFIRRLENLPTNRMAIGDYSRYDIIITAHVSKFFGFSKYDNSFWKRTILFPMFCTSSYKTAGEIVPLEYTFMEREVILRSNKIITPSEEEKNKLISDYNCDASKIRVIYRGINPAFYPSNQSIVGKRFYNIIYIGSIKPQKNNIEAIGLLNILNQSNIKFHIHFVCTIQDHELYNKLLLYIKKCNLQNDVFFHISISQEALATLIRKMDISISVSNWETFGRGIYEGIASGLPTFVPKHLKVIRELCDGNPGVVLCDGIEDMASKIFQVVNHPDVLEIMKHHLPEIASKVDYFNERHNLLKEILG